MSNWKLLKEHFKSDGSLRDLYIHGTDIHDWQRFLDYLKDQKIKTEFWIDGTSADLPKSIEGVVILRDKTSLLLEITVKENLLINCHFFLNRHDADPIELDLDPKQVQSAEDFECLWGFVFSIGKFLMKRIDITHENSPDSVIATFIP